MKSKIQILIVDDHSYQIEDIISVLKNGLANFDSHFNVLTYTNPIEAIAHINKKHFKPDIILLDVDMPEMDGFEFVDSCGYNRLVVPEPYIIFISAYENFEYFRSASDRRLEYLVKGSEVSNILTLKIQEYLNTWTITHYHQSQSTLYHLMDICYFEAYEGGSYMICKENNIKILLGKTLGEIEVEERILVKGFVRIHESYIVNRFHIRKYISGGRGKLSFDSLLHPNLAVIPIGKKYRKESDIVRQLISKLKGKG